MTALTISNLCASLLYLFSGFAILGALRKGADARASSLIRWPVLIGLVCHAFSLYGEMFREGAVNFGFGYAMSEMCFFAVIILLVETWIHRLHAQFGIVLVSAAVGTLFTLIFPSQIIAASEWTQLFRWHLILAIAAYAFLMIALVQAVLMSLQDKRLRAAGASDDQGFLESLPALVVMERIFFRILSVGFCFITLTLIVGALATNEAYGVFFRLDHKMILTWLAWILFGILLLGRVCYGWRARTALSWFWAGITLFAVAYFGYSFVQVLC